MIFACSTFRESGVKENSFQELDWELGLYFRGEDSNIWVLVGCGPKFMHYLGSQYFRGQAKVPNLWEPRLTTEFQVSESINPGKLF